MKKKKNIPFYDKKKININDIILKKIEAIHVKKNSKNKRYLKTSLNSR